MIADSKFAQQRNLPVLGVYTDLVHLSRDGIRLHAFARALQLD